MKLTVYSLFISFVSCCYVFISVHSAHFLLNFSLFFNSTHPLSSVLNDVMLF